MAQIEQKFQLAVDSNRISAFFGLDVILSTIGVSSALPLFLLLRESRIQSTTRLG